MVTKQILEDIFERRFIDAKDNWKAKCPFHDEKSPSFYISKESYLCNCFGCGYGGRLEAVTAKLKEISVSQARELLGIDVQDIITRNKNYVKRREPQIFPESWLAPFKKGVHKYVIQRGFSLETLLLVNSLYDEAGKRQIFPHRDRDGRLLGCAGRACYGQEPKWLFYWSYDKGQALYLHNPQQLLPNTPLIIVEGIFDALWFIQNGYLNVAATLGTKVTMKQVRDIRSLTDHVYLAMDNDSSGAECTNWLYSKLKRSVNVSFCTYPPGYKDPVGMSKDELDSMIQHAQNPLQHKLNGLQRNSISSADTGSGVSV